MAAEIFPPLPLESWRTTRDTIQKYARIVGKVRRALTPRQKHWWHISLRTSATGLTTTPMSAGTFTVEIIMDFSKHELLLLTSRGENLKIPMQGQSAAAFGVELVDALDECDVVTPLQRGEFVDDTPGAYDQEAVHNAWQALSQIDMVLKTFRATLRQESSSVQFWPHHFDLAMLWFSGRLVPDQDPDDPAYADEQMNFGFSTGDDSIPEPYFYATAYPTPAEWTAQPLPDNAYWHTNDFTAAILPYQSLVGVADGQDQLLHFWQTAFQAGSRWMK